MKKNKSKNKSQSKNKRKCQDACRPVKESCRQSGRRAYVFVDTENVGFCLPASFEKGIDLYMYTTNDKTHALYPEYLSGKHIHFLHPQCVDHSSKNELDFCLIADAAALCGSLSEKERANAHIIILSHDRDFDFPIRYLSCRFPDCRFERLNMNAAQWFESRHLPEADSPSEKKIWKESFLPESKKEEDRAQEAVKKDEKARKQEEKHLQKAEELFDADFTEGFDYDDDRDYTKIIEDGEIADELAGPSDRFEKSSGQNKQKKKKKKAKKAQKNRKQEPETLSAQAADSAETAESVREHPDSSMPLPLFDQHPNLRALWKQKNNYDDFKRGMTKKVRTSLRIFPDKLENPFVWFEQDPYSQSWLLYYSGSKVGAYPSLDKGLASFQKYYQKAMLQQRIVKSAKKNTKKPQTRQV